jgi:hypothetical protein
MSVRFWPLDARRRVRGAREGRHRGENEAWVPAERYRFHGDIADTGAVRHWIETEILPRDAAANGKWVQTAVLKGPSVEDPRERPHDRHLTGLLSA